MAPAMFARIALYTVALHAVGHEKRRRDARKMLRTSAGRDNAKRAG
jgi:hypothetical protein